MKNGDIPEVGSVWRHKGGSYYEVIIVSNLSSDRLDEYPVTVTYKRITDNTVWSRPLPRWHDSMFSCKGLS